MLILSRKVDERIIIGDRIQVSVVEIRGDQVKIGIDAPQDVKVYRQEVFEAIQAENRAAALSDIKLPTLEEMMQSTDSATDEQSSDENADSDTNNTDS